VWGRGAEGAALFNQFGVPAARSGVGIRATSGGSSKSAMDGGFVAAQRHNVARQRLTMANATKT